MRNVWGDYDNDGDRDLFSHNFIVSTLYRAGPTGFEDVNSASGLEVCETNGTGASWVDLNNDGYLDVYAVEYAAGRPASEHVNLMFVNNGDGTFTDITEAAGVDLPDNPMGVVFGDYDNDGDQDVFLTNSHVPPYGAPSRLYRNDGWGPDGIPSFTDVGAEAGVDISTDDGRGFGAAWGDYDNDGRLDLLYAREADSRLFHNDGPNGQGVWTFSDMTGQGGLDFESLIYQGCAFADLDNNGFLDLILTEGDFGPNRIFMNNGDGSWLQTAELVGMELPLSSMMGAVPADIDNDGDLDLIWFDHLLGNPNRLFYNESHGNNWVQFRLTGIESNRDAVGARIMVRAAISPGTPQNNQIRKIVAGTGFFDDVPRIQTFGLGKSTIINKVQIKWPSGVIQNLGPLAVNARYDIVEPAGESMRLSTEESLELLPEDVVLGRNYPNPFNPKTQFDYILAQDAWISLKVYNTLGQEIATLAEGFTEAGTRTATWNGRTSFGAPVSSGIYVYRLSANGIVRTGKMMLMK